MLRTILSITLLGIIGYFLYVTYMGADKTGDSSDTGSKDNGEKSGKKTGKTDPRETEKKKEKSGKEEPVEIKKKKEKSGKSGNKDSGNIIDLDKWRFNSKSPAPVRPDSGINKEDMVTGIRSMENGIGTSLKKG